MRLGEFNTRMIHWGEDICKMAVSCLLYKHLDGGTEKKKGKQKWTSIAKSNGKQHAVKKQLFITQKDMHIKNSKLQIKIFFSFRNRSF